MATKFEVKAPDGKKYDVNAPDGATQEDAIKYVQQKFYSGSSFADVMGGAPLKSEDRPEAPEEQLTPQQQAARDMPWLDRNLAALGSIPVGYGEGIKSLFGGEEDPSTIAAVKGIQREAPIGALTGEAALFGLPGAKIFSKVAKAKGLANKSGAVKTITASGASGAGVGGMSGAIAPLEEGQSRAKSAALGTVAGGVFGSGIPMLGYLARQAGRATAPALSKGASQNAAARTALQATGIKDGPQKARETIAALRGGESFETAAEAAAPVGRAEFSGLQTIASSRWPSEFAKSADDAIAVTGFKKGNKVIQRDPVTKKRYGAWEDLNTSTGPARNAAIERANETGVRLSELEKLINKQQSAVGKQRAGIADDLDKTTFGAGRNEQLEMHRALMAEGMEAARNGDAAKAAMIAQQIDELGKVGLAPLKVDNVVSSINTIANKSGNKSNDVLQQSLAVVKEKLAKVTDPKSGIIDANELYTIRKTIGKDIRARLGAGGAPFDKQQVAGVESSIQKMIDDAIENAGGVGWKDYLKTYAEGAEKIGAALRRRESNKALSKAGLTEAMRISGVEQLPSALPNTLNFKVSLANRALQAAQGRAGGALNLSLGELMLPQNKKLLADLMEKELQKYGQTSGLLGTAGFAGSRSADQYLRE